MRRLTFLLLLVPALLLPAGAGAAAPTPRERALYEDHPNGMYLLESGWEVAEKKAGPYKKVSVPDAWNARTLDDASFKGGVRFYRTRFRPPAGEAAAWNLRFESVNRNAEVTLNGAKAGEHSGAYLPFELPARVQPGENTLLVKVDNRLSKNDLPPGNRPRGWWNYGGILREVYLRRLSALDLENPRVQATPGTPGKVTVSGTLFNPTGAPTGGPAKLQATGPGGFAASPETAIVPVPSGQRVDFSTSFDVPSPALWSPDSPSLYELKVTLPGGQVTTVHFGFRTWSVSPDGHALLNGRPLSLRGASFHEDAPGRGHALRPGDRRRLVSQLEGLGADLTRAHYPVHPALLEAFDREGIVYWDQIPVWRLRGADLARLRPRASAAFEQMILRDRNHASIMTWSAENETLGGGSAEQAYLADARQKSTALDGTRLLATDTTLPPGSIPDFYADSVDVIGLNEYVGWYGKTPLSQLAQIVSDFHARFPKQGLFLTEFGAEANRAGPASQKGTYGFQRSFLDKTLTVFDQDPMVSGAVVWALRDFPVRPGWDGGNPKPTPPYLFKGVYGKTGGKKPAFSVVKRHFDSVPSTAP